MAVRVHRFSEGSIQAQSGLGRAGSHWQTSTEYMPYSGSHVEQSGQPALGHRNFWYAWSSQ